MEMRVHGEVSYLLLTFKHNKKCDKVFGVLVMMCTLQGTKAD